MIGRERARDGRHDAARWRRSFPARLLAAEWPEEPAARPEARAAVTRQLAAAEQGSDRGEPHPVSTHSLQTISRTETLTA